MAEKIMIASGKGGVGKTTLCLYLAAGLAAGGYKVLIVEADTGFRGMDVALSLEDRAVFDLSDLLEGRCTQEEALLRHTALGMELICAPNDPEYLPEKGQLAALFHQLQGGYDYLLVDCGAGFGPLQGQVCRLCDLALVITTPDKVAVRAAARTSQLLHQKGLHRQRLIINRIPKSFLPAPALRDLDDVIDLVGAQLLGAVPEGTLGGLCTPTGSRTPTEEELFRIAQRLAGKEAELVLS